jgi:hypothetical protein
MGNCARGHFGHVEGVKAEFVGVGIRRLHHLDHGCPFNFLTLFNGFPQVALGVVRVFATHARGFFLSELLLPVLGDEVVLDVDKLALGVDPFECVAAVSVLVAPAFGGTMIAEEHETGMIALRSICEQIEERVIIGKEVLGSRQQTMG